LRPMGAHRQVKRTRDLGPNLSED